MTTAALFLAVAVVCLVVGFLVGENRAVKQANGILDANMRELFKAIGDDTALPVEDETEDRPTVH